MGDATAVPIINRPLSKSLVGSLGSELELFQTALFSKPIEALINSREPFALRKTRSESGF